MIPGVCNSGGFCGLCRDSSDAGIRWRNTFVAAKFESSPDFECPQGHPWDYQPDPNVVPLDSNPSGSAAPQLASDDGRRDARLAVCEKCSHFDLSGPTTACKLLSKCASKYDRVLRGYSAPPEGCPLKNNQGGLPHVDE
ncbi:hypothetical protein LLG95_12885 [bacterium]|nr:hypothetical protein [bacterium]